MDQRDEIKARLSIFDLVSEYVELKKAGRNFRGLCPFHSEKSPSFVVSPDKEIAHCFGCGKGGDVFAFYQEVEGVDFINALKDLGSKVGVQIVEVNKAQVAENKSIKDMAYDLHELACSFFEEDLHNSDEGKKVLKYLKGRGLSNEIIKKYRIGFSIDSFDNLYKKFLTKGFAKSEIVESGLAIAKDTNLASIFDRFRLRLMFPIFSKDGKVIGFGGRALKADESAKYLNSPDTPIYHKSDVLYGFNFAKDSIRKKETVILVEGYFDQIAMYQAGVKNVVAVSGTALTPRQLQMLKKISKNIMFCLDSDNAGIEALYRSAELALIEGFNLKVIDLKEFKDPGEILQKDENLLPGFIENSVDFFDHVLELEYFSKSELERTDMVFLQKFIAKIIPIIKRISSPILQDVVVRKFATAIGVKNEVLYEEMKKVQKTPIVSRGNDTAQVLPAKKSFNPEEHFWGHLFWYPEIFKQFYDKVVKFDFVWLEKEVYKQFVDYYNNDRDLSVLRLVDLDVSEELKQKYSIIVVYLESVSSEDWNVDLVSDELERLLERLVKEYKKRQGSMLESQIRLAESNKDRDLVRSLNLKVKELQVLSL
jgi:DNA primase